MEGIGFAQMVIAAQVGSKQSVVEMVQRWLKSLETGVPSGSFPGSAAELMLLEDYMEGEGSLSFS